MTIRKGFVNIPDQKGGQSKLNNSQTLIGYHFGQGWIANL